MKKLSLKASDFQRGEVLTRSQLKKVLGGDGSSDGSSSGSIQQCRFKYKFNNIADWGPWTVWGDYSSDCNSICVDLIESGQVKSCGYESRTATT